MPLICDIIVDPGIVVDRTDLLADLIQHSAGDEAALGCGAWHMSLRLSDDATIAELHDRFFADPTPTDVITFPSGEMHDEAGAYLGDVVVSVQTAARQAVDVGHSTEREIAFLALHGLLHLTGHDDETAEQRRAMHGRQMQLLERWERGKAQPW